MGKDVIIALDFDSKVILYDLTSKALVFEDSADRDEASNSDNKKISLIFSFFKEILAYIKKLFYNM